MLLTWSQGRTLYRISHSTFAAGNSALQNSRICGNVWRVPAVILQILSWVYALKRLVDVVGSWCFRRNRNITILFHVWYTALNAIRQVCPQHTPPPPCPRYCCASRLSVSHAQFAVPECCHFQVASSASEISRRILAPVTSTGHY